MYRGPRRAVVVRRLPGPRPSSTRSTTAEEPSDPGVPIGPFSRVWQGFTDPTLGPFDPQRPWQTLLSNGVLDAGDAPMPAARVDWAIAPNSGAPGDISGVGSIFPSIKSFTVHPQYRPHPLYAPFYALWIPAAYPSIGSALGGDPPFFVPEASGITGPANATRDAG